MAQYSDNELVLKYRAGESEALAILIRRYLKPIYFFCLNFVKNDEANDLAQEVFIKVWKKLNRFDANKNFRVWIFAVARNTCLDYLRKKRSVLFSELKKDETGDSIEENIEDTGSTPLEKLSADDLKRETDELLKRLPIQTRLVFELYYRDQLTFQEIADTLNTSINTVKSRHLRGIRQLRQLMNAPK